MHQRLGDLTNELAIFSQQRSLARAVVAMGRAEIDPGAFHMPERIVRENWKDDKDALSIAQKGAVVPASTSGVTPFNQTSISNLISLLGPGAASRAIFAASLNVSLDNSYGLTVPTMTASGTGVSFVGEGSPLKVRQYAFSGPTLTPKKVGFISHYTRELFKASNADTLIRALLIENLSVGLDTILLDATAADTTRPAGLRNGVAATTATAGGGTAAMVGDLANLASAVAPVANGQIVFVASAKQAVKINLMRTWALPYPLLSSAGLEDGVVLALAANALAVSGSDDPPKIAVSSEAVMHTEDGSPAAFSTVGTPNTVAAPLRSLFQTDTIALRLLADVNWALRASGAVAWTQSVTW